MATLTEPAAAVLARLADGLLTTQLLHVAAALRIADGPASAAQLAAGAGLGRTRCTGVLRGLAAERVLDELPDDRFMLTPVGELLRERVPGSMRGAVLARGRLYYAMLAGLLGAVREGGSAFERVHGRTFFDHLAAVHARAAGRPGAHSVRVRGAAGGGQARARAGDSNRRRCACAGGRAPLSSDSNLGDNRHDVRGATSARRSHPFTDRPPPGRGRTSGTGPTSTSDARS